MKRVRLALLASALTVAMAVSACGSSGTKSTGSASTGGGEKTLTVGVLTDLTGPSASGFTSTELGIKAAVGAINDAGVIKGVKLKYVMADTQSTTQGALSAAQSLVQKDKVFMIMESSAYFFGAVPYLFKEKVPVVGGGFDGDEWSNPKYTNIFSSVTVTDTSLVENTTGLYMKARGVTSCGSIGYAILSSARGAEGAVKSCAAVGLKNSYLNTQIPYGSTDLGAVAIAIKNAGVNGLVFSTVPNTAFALLARLKQLGVTLKSALLPVGYGGDLLQDKGAVAAAQGYEFLTVGEPVEMKTPATESFQAALAKYAGVTGTPTFAEYQAYIGMYAIAAGLKLTAADPTRANFITKLRGVKDFDGAGLFGTHVVDFSQYHSHGTGGGVSGSCIWAAKLTGSTFAPVPDTPICGSIIPGAKLG
jgi:branched-chain amino acid transport system substrate-binding protein